MGRWLVVGWLGLWSAGEAQAGRAGQISFDMVRWDFPSGLNVVTLPDPELPAVTTAMILDAGSGADPEGKEGLAHLVEHLVFRGSVPADPLVPDGGSVADVQHALGCDANAFTEVDVVTYISSCPPEAFGVMMAIEAQRLADPLRGVDEDAFASEQRVVAIERAERDRTGFLSLDDAVLDAIHPPGHPYGHAPAGTEAAIASMTLADAREFAEAHMRPSGATLVIAGPMTSEAMLNTLLPLLPDGALHPRLLASGIRSYQTRSEGGEIVDRVWAEDPDQPGRALSLLGKERREVKGVTRAAVPVGKQELRAPVSQGTAVAAWILPPTSELPLVTGGMLAGLAAGQVRREFGKKSRNRGCSARELVGETVLVCWAAPKEGDAPAAWARRLAGIMVDAGDLSDRFRGLEDPSSFGVRLAESLESVSVFPGNRAAVVARFVHLGGEGPYLAFQQRLVQGANWQRAWRTLREEALPWQAMRGLVLPSDRSVDKESGSDGHEARPSGSMPLVRTPVTPMDPERFAWETLPNGVQVVAVRTSNMPLAEVAVFVPRGSDVDPLWASTSERVVRWVVSGGESTTYLRRSRWGQGPDWTMRAIRGRAASLQALLNAARAGAGPGVVDKKDVAAERKRVTGRQVAWQKSASRSVREAWREAIPSLYRTPWHLDDEAFTSWRKEMPVRATSALEARWHAGGGLVVIAGNVSPAAAVQEAAQRFGSWTVQDVEAPKEGASAPASGTPSVILIDDPDAATVRIDARCMTPPVPGSHALADVLTTALSAQLMRTLRESEGLAYTPSGVVTRHGDRTLVDLVVTTPVGTVRAATERVFGLLEHLDAGRWEAEDVDAARERAKRAAVLGRADRSGVLDSLRRAWSDGVDVEAWAEVRPWYDAATVEAATAMTAGCRREAVVQVIGPMAKLRASVQDQVQGWRVVEVTGR